jgi:hypothetical protein
MTVGFKKITANFSFMTPSQKTRKKPQRIQKKTGKDPTRFRYMTPK